ncbi:adenosylhomocysteinase [Tenacibaculum tangerinum]|uniref:Adenosylhomocysteinase n=1 Tax=Tenacibaculum tangerinum TaxID=3038772 RepID=A0ABY8L103_9FLAO|nr:adenosylhomocysteinase [Tenacibaculum tangerinum]WGH74776.1 adenosylhomocysteinase [Tenacibaculum tangerinum]
MNTFHPPFLNEVRRRIGLKKYKNVKQFVVQHLYPDTLRLLLLLHEYIPISVVVSISYSGSDEVIEALRNKGIKVVTPDFDTLDTVIINELKNCFKACETEKHQLLIHEVGGYTIRILHEFFDTYLHHVIGAVEVTKQGVWEARKLKKLKIPQLNCAETKLKEIEGKMVGESVVASLDYILRDIGYAMVGRKACVFGYGWVGSGVAHSLRARGMAVTVYDTDVIKLVEAAVNGFQVLKSTSDVGTYSVIIGASGTLSISKNVIDGASSRCFLVSGSSKDKEIDLTYLKSQQKETRAIHRHINNHILKDGRQILLVNEGYPVNFTGSSVPDEIVEFLFAELIILIKVLLEETPSPGIYPLDKELEKIPATVWLEMR